MKRSFAAGLALLLLSVAPARAQSLPTDPPSIIIFATGRAEAPAEFAGIEFKVRGEGATKVAALKAMTVVRSHVEESLPGLVGASKVALAATTLTFYELRPPECSSESDYSDAPKSSAGACRVTGYIAQLSMHAEIWPAERLGDAASLLAQLGADGVEPGSGKIQDEDALSAKATKAALDDARRQAERIAFASGGRLGRVLRIQDPRATSDNPMVLGGFAAPAALQARPAIQPEVSVNLKVEPVAASSLYIVVFELLK